MKFLISLLVAVATSTTALANDCSCIHKANQAKQTTSKTDHWWGTSIEYYCDYTCTYNGEEFVYRANHKTWWTGDEEGNEYVCDGTIYQQKFSVSSNWFYYAYMGSKHFSPKKSSSKDLKAWAIQSNCR